MVVAHSEDEQDDITARKKKESSKPTVATAAIAYQQRGEKGQPENGGKACEWLIAGGRFIEYLECGDGHCDSPTPACRSLCSHLRRAKNEKKKNTACRRLD